LKRGSEHSTPKTVDCRKTFGKCCCSSSDVFCLTGPKLESLNYFRRLTKNLNA